VRLNDLNAEDAKGMHAKGRKVFLQEILCGTLAPLGLRGSNSASLRARQYPIMMTSNLFIGISFKL
jgi:hypothetical protein